MMTRFFWLALVLVVSTPAQDIFAEEESTSAGRFRRPGRRGGEFR